MIEADSKAEVKKGPFPQYPEGSDMPGVRRILEKTSAVSRKSRIRIPNPSGEGFNRASERPDALRRTRREPAEKIKLTPREERFAIIEKLMLGMKLPNSF